MTTDLGAKDDWSLGLRYLSMCRRTRGRKVDVIPLHRDVRKVCLLEGFFDNLQG